MPERCASIRSIAKWVLPVLVGPRMAIMRCTELVTTEEGATTCDLMTANLSGRGWLASEICSIHCQDNRSTMIGAASFVMPDRTRSPYFPY